MSQKLDMIKIDTEGCELKVLKGGEALIREHHPIIFNGIFLSKIPFNLDIMPKR